MYSNHKIGDCMKKLIIILLISLLLASCVAEPQPEQRPDQSISEVQNPEPPVTLLPPQEQEDDDPLVYKPGKNMTIEETVEAYFEQQYIAYSTFTDIDMSAIVDMKSTTNRNMVRWLKMLTQRRKLIFEYDFSYVETEKFPYAILFEEEAEDDRMRIWEQRIEELDATIIHFRIEGEEGKAYPPIMALNSQHSMMFRRIDGIWKIATHYFPGSRRKYGTGTVTVPTEDEMMVDLALEFEPLELGEPMEIPEGTREYDAKSAVEYAIEYTEIKNPGFYDIGDWIGNCANFVSQTVWAGFGANRMTGEWYNGSPAWNHVGYFWDYITNSQELVGQQLAGVSELRNGDIIQTRPLSMVDEPDRFTHELIVIDDETLMLSQNTPAAFVYYSDLVNVQTRIIRPVYLR